MSRDCHKSPVREYYMIAGKIKDRGKHSLVVLKSSARDTGVPTWQCRYCKDTTKAT